MVLWRMVALRTNRRTDRQTWRARVMQDRTVSNISWPPRRGSYTTSTRSCVRLA